MSPKIPIPSTTRTSISSWIYIIKNEANYDNPETTDNSRTGKDDMSRTNRDDSIENVKAMKNTKYYDKYK